MTDSSITNPGIPKIDPGLGSPVRTTHTCSCAANQWQPICVVKPEMSRHFWTVPPRLSDRDLSLEWLRQLWFKCLVMTTCCHVMIVKNVALTRTRTLTCLCPWQSFSWMKKTMLPATLQQSHTLNAVKFFTYLLIYLLTFLLRPQTQRNIVLFYFLAKHSAGICFLTLPFLHDCTV